jgi:uncharacterized lipoprotein YajG
MTFTEINDTTGFANGDKFTSDEQVREYFTTENMRGMLDGENTNTQDELNDMAETVIANRWHYAGEEN